MASYIYFDVSTDLYIFKEKKIDIRSQSYQEEIRNARKLRKHFRLTHRPDNLHRFVPTLPTVFESNDVNDIICPTPIKGTSVPRIIITEYLK